MDFSVSSLEYYQPGKMGLVVYCLYGFIAHMKGNAYA